VCSLFKRERERENGARVRRQPSKSFRRRKCFLFLSSSRNFIRGTASGFREAKPSPSLSVEKLTFVLSFLCAFSSLKQQKKKWEKQALNQNGKPLRVKMHVKTNDKVIVIAGADKGKVTEVVEVFTKNGQILCKDVNIKTKHVKPRNEGESGSIIQREFPIHHSNVMHYSAAEKKRSRVGKKMEGDKKVRVLKATGEVLAN
jgi:large subunit ribosomal protein L24